MRADHPQSFADTEIADDFSLLPLGHRSAMRDLAAASGKTRRLDPERFSIKGKPAPVLTHGRQTAASQARASGNELRASERQQAAVAAAYQNGVIAGDTAATRREYKRGFSWGFICGLVLTCLLGSLSIIFVVMALGRTMPRMF